MRLTTALLARAGIAAALPLNQGIPEGAKNPGEAIEQLPEQDAGQGPGHGRPVLLPPMDLPDGFEVKAPSHSVDPSDGSIPPQGASVMQTRSLLLRTSAEKDDDPYKPKKEPGNCLPGTTNAAGQHNCYNGRQYGSGSAEGDAKSYPSWSAYPHEFEPGTTSEELKQWQAEHNPGPMVDARTGVDVLGENEIKAVVGPQTDENTWIAPSKQNITLFDSQNGPINGIDYSHLNDDLTPKLKQFGRRYVPIEVKEDLAEADSSSQREEADPNDYGVP